MGEVSLRPLTVEDVREVIALARVRKDVVQPIVSIDAESTDKLKVSTGREPLQFRTFVHTNFIALKRNGKWEIDNNSVKQETVTGPSYYDPDESVIVE
ncbi:MAG: hypothetical protein DME57_02665 [Verrucomicrobia bacterium]|nr:MAG: hypothetical protein DME57_02665 [Verrucomicrobiota bacterium]